MAKVPDHLDDVAGHERQLQRFAARQAADAAGGDGDLARILAFVHDRRRTRRHAEPAADGLAPARREPEAAPTRASVDEDGAEPPATGRESAGQVLSIVDVGPTMRILRLGRPSGLSFRAGQHIRAGLADVRRGKFSVASAPHEPHVELCVQLIAGGRLTPALFGLHAGDRVELGDTAKGSFQLRTDAATHLMVATGTGIAPFRSMVRDAQHRHLDGRFVILHGASHVDELPYREELAADSTLTYQPTVSRPTDARNRGWTGRTGRVDALAAEVAAPLDPATTHVYACGNKGMVDAVTSALGGAGFAVSREVYD